jgi:Tannase-like family of unknown function (DUF6351)
MKIMRSVLPLVVLALGLSVALSSCGDNSISSGNGAAGSGAVIKVLSNRADLISGGDALIEVDPPTGTDTAVLHLSLNGKDVTQQFTVGANGKFMGLVSGLVNGNNVLSAQGSGLQNASITIVNHPQGGPVLAGPQLQPWTCQAGATDAQCNQAPAYTWFYKSTDPTKQGLQGYDPNNPASDVANTTTDLGFSVPFLVRVETGYQDRDQYQIAILYQPGQLWTAPNPQKQFNHKLLITHGASCGVEYQTGTAPSVLTYDPAGKGTDSVLYALGAGFAVMSTALDNSGHNCDVATQVESIIMAKEHLIESYGTLRYTVGTGCSGGSLAQQWMANAYPGVYQGILPTCSFPDAWTSAVQVADYHMLINYFDNPSTSGRVQWTTAQQGAVEDDPLTTNAINSNASFFYAILPTNPCSGIGAQQIYNPQTNPAGTRCSIADLAINILAPREQSTWSANEQLLGRGFAGIPVDNVGVQYGLAALQNQQISLAQFLDVNVNIGGIDVDINPTAQRRAADEPALANAYRSGMINETNNLDRTAIIDCRGPNPELVHDSYRAFAVRARLDREHGGHNNQLIWEGPTNIVGDEQCHLKSLIAMDQWLAAVEQDTGTASLAQKIVNDKPSSLSDACWDGVGNKLSNQLCGPQVVPVYGTPRMVAGDAITTDANKCQLKPLSRSDNYGPTPFSNAQWLQMQQTFPAGVCDFSKPAVDQQGTVPWLTYQDSQGKVVYGGQPLSAAAANSGSGWASAAFAVFSN